MAYMNELSVSNALTKEKIGHKITNYCGELTDGTIELLGNKQYHISVGCFESSICFWNEKYLVIGDAREKISDIVTDVKNVLSGKLNLDN